METAWNRRAPNHCAPEQSECGYSPLCEKYGRTQNMGILRLRTYSSRTRWDAGPQGDEWPDDGDTRTSVGTLSQWGTWRM